MPDKKLPTYPSEHQPALEVPEGGSSCATCRFYEGDQKCGSPDYVKYYGTDAIPLPPDRWCSDWWEAAPGALEQKSRFVGDDEEARSWTIIKGGGAGEPESEEPEDPEQAEDEFVKWSDEMDARDARQDAADRRAKALAAIAASGVDLTRGTSDDPTPLLDRSDEYLERYARSLKGD